MIVLSDEKQICMLGHVQYHNGEMRPYNLEVFSKTVGNLRNRPTVLLTRLQDRRIDRRGKWWKQSKKYVL